MSIIFEIFIKLSELVSIPSAIVIGILVLGLVYFVLPKLQKVALIMFSFYKKVIKLLSLSEQFEPNGGSSVMDKLNKIGTELQVMNGKINCVMDLSSQDKGFYFEACEEGEYFRLNQGWTELTGLTPEQGIGNGWVNCIHESDRERVWKEWRQAIEQEREFNLEYYIFNRLLNQKIKVKGMTTVVRDIDGKPIRYIGTISRVNENIIQSS